MQPCLLLSLPPRSRNHSPRTLLPLRQCWVPVWHLSQTISADPTLLAQGQEGQRGTPGVHLLPVFPASCFPLSNKLLRVEEVDRSGTQSRKLGAPKSQHPDCNNGRVSSRKREKHRLRLSGSAAARLSEKGQSPESGIQTGRTSRKSHQERHQKST